MEDFYNNYGYVPSEPPHNPLGCLIAVIIAMLFCAILGACKTRESVQSERVVYDTIWSEKTAQSAKNDSIVYRERIVVQPHVIRVGDTTIVYSDTTIVRVAEQNHYITRNVYQDKGQIIRDTAYIEKQVPVTVKESAKSENKWATIWVGILIGIALALAVKYRKTLLSFIRRLIRMKE